MGPDVEARAVEPELSAQDLDALRRRVLNVVPHALRTPITTLAGLARTLEHADQADIRDEIGPAIVRLASLAERLLDDLLIAARYTTAFPTSEAEPVRLADLLREVWSALDEGSGRELDIDGDIGATALAPAGVARGILERVLDNALRYGEAPTSAHLEAGRDHVSIVVHSPGPPVDEDPSLLVEAFYRSERAVMVAPGLGVGLTVAANLAEHAGGGLEVAARAGGGLVTTVSLPPGTAS